MSSIFQHAFAAPPVDRRLAGLAVTLLVHAALVVGWQMARPLPPAQTGAADEVQWLRLPPVPTLTPPVEAAPRVPPDAARPRIRSGATRDLPPSLPDVPRREPQAASASEPAVVQPEAAPAPAAETPATPRPTAADIVESARRSVGSIDRALRKDAKPTIVAPPDSPQIRMRERMEQARALAPPRLWEAPKVEELVNNTGDGARRTRVITGNGTYCITSRSPATGIDMIEMHGREMLTSCPKHETPARKQVWRTARD